MYVEILKQSDDAPLGMVIETIVNAHEQLERFWSAPRGWAPDEVAVLFERCRLDRQTQLARCLKLWMEPGAQDVAEGRLILARTTLGALVEGAMKLVLTVFHQDYAASPEAPRRGKNQVLVAAPDITFEALRVFFQKNVWLPKQVEPWTDWVEETQRRRNAVHAYSDRELGTHQDFVADVRRYLEFLGELNDRLPYP